MRAALAVPLSLLGLLGLSPGPAGAAEISRYATRLELAPDGSGHATSTLVVSGDPSETLEIPLGTGAFSNLRLSEAPEGLLLEPPKGGARTARVTLPPAAAAAAAAAAATATTATAAAATAAAAAANSTFTFTLTFDVPGTFDRVEDAAAGDRLTIPRESRTLRYAFVNTQAAPVRDFDALVVLPAGYRVQSIREQLPKPKRTEAEPRVRLGASEGRQNALLQLTNLGQGDSVSMRLEVVPGGRSPLWLLAGVVLSALYLFRFRDLVAPGADSKKD